MMTMEPCEVTAALAYILKTMLMQQTDKLRRTHAWESRDHGIVT